LTTIIDHRRRLPIHQNTPADCSTSSLWQKREPHATGDVVTVSARAVEPRSTDR
jgi:hypothetical protein